MTLSFRNGVNSRDAWVCAYVTEENELRGNVPMRCERSAFLLVSVLLRGASKLISGPETFETLFDFSFTSFNG